MKAIRADFPTDWPTANIYTLADLHIGDPHCVPAEVTRRIEAVKSDPYGLCILNGDLLNTALRNSVSDIYGEKMSPMQQIIFLADLLQPIAKKVIAATTGNHEARVYRADGIDIMRMVCRELGIEDKYNPDGVLVFLRFGTRCSHSRHTDKNQRQWYSIYATHGSGGGRKEGAKAIRLADMAAILDADVYFHSHTHLPMIMKQAFFRTDSSNCSVRKVEKLFVNTGAALSYGGYGQAQEFKPASIQTPIVHLEAYQKRATATL